MDLEPQHDLSLEKEKARYLNWTASLLNVIPGLGHIYKGHVVTGMLLFFVGIPLTVILAFMLIIPTAGLSLLLPLMYWVWAMTEVYWIEDRPTMRYRYFGLS